MKAIPPDNGGRRCGIDQRQFSYHAYIPERRGDVNRRSAEEQSSAFFNRISIMVEISFRIHFD
jgi:hypothetical protein